MLAYDICVCINSIEIGTWNFYMYLHIYRNSSIILEIMESAFVSMYWWLDKQQQQQNAVYAWLILHSQIATKKKFFCNKMMQLEIINLVK